MNPGASAGAGADLLSALSDELLHHVMSSLKAWDMVRTCALSTRWRDLWASAPCVDLRVGYGSSDGEPPEDLPDFARILFCCRDKSAALDTLRLLSSDVDGAHDENDARLWIRTAIRHGARAIHLVGHRRGALAALEHVSFMSCRLRTLRLSYVPLDDYTLLQISYDCSALEELHLKDCLITGHEISSASLKVLTMFKCRIDVNLCIAVPNLVLLRCILPINQAPSFENMGSLVTGTIVLDDSAFNNDFEDFNIKAELDETTDEDDNSQQYMTGYGFGDKDGFDYGSDIDCDDNTTYEYSEIANDDFDVYGFDADGCSSSTDGNCLERGENSGCNRDRIIGGRNVLQSLSNATSLELFADAGEVILTREKKKCPNFNNLKTLSLGEWCIDADFDTLVSLLQHAPNLERLFLELKLKLTNRNPLESSVKPKEGRFTCRHLRMVKIKCSKDDARVHMLAHLFRANGTSDEKIFVRRTGSTYLRGKKMTRDVGRHELESRVED